jgi:AraC-like DNA-binding protein
MPTDQNSPPISTILTPAERRSVDAAGQGLYETLHRDSIDEVIRDVRERRAGAVVVSVSRCMYGAEATLVAGLVREFPRIPAIALLSTAEPASSHTLLTLGRSGVRTLVDVRSPDGWRALRQALIDDAPNEIRRMALDRLVDDLAGAPDSCVAFFEILFSAKPSVTTVRTLAPLLHLTPARLASRLYHLQLPTARRFLNGVRLVRAARLLENRGMSIANVSNRMEYSSPQAFSRHLGVILHMTATQFRREYNGERMLEWFRWKLITPYIEALRRFDPSR